MDTDCGNFMKGSVMADLIKTKKIDMTLVDTALKNLFRVQIRLGFLDPKELNPYSSLGDEHKSKEP